MTIERFRLSPLAIVREGADEKDVRLAVSLELEQLDDSPTKLVNITFSDSGRTMRIDSIVNQESDEWSWLGVEGSVFTARAIRPSDAELSGSYGYDLPVAVLGAIAYGQLENPIMLQAIVDEDNERVITLLLASDAGLYARYDTLWHPVTDPEVFTGTYLLDVTEDAIQLYDAADQIGGQVAAAAMPVGEGNITDGSIPVPPDTPEPSSVPLMASGVPVIEDRAQLDEAITAAVNEPSMRWYVEKRAQALGAEVEFPWE